MKSTKKILSIVLASVMSLGIITGCAKNTVTPPATPDEKKPVTVTFWHGWSGAEEETLMTAIENYKSVEPHVTIETLQVPFDQLQEKLKLAVQSGNGPDLFVGPHDWTGVFGASNLLEGLSDYIADVKGDYLESALDAGKFGGRQYGIPISLNGPVLIYNKDIVKEAPKTTDELLEVAKANTGDGKFGLVMDIGNFYFQHGFFTGFGNEVFKEVTEQRVTPGFDGQGTVDFLNFLNRIKNVDKVIPQEIDYNTMMALFTEGKSTFMINGPWSFGDLDKAGVNYGIVDYPSVTETGKVSKPFMGVTMFFVPKGAVNIDEATDFAKFFTAKETAKLMNEKAGQISANKNVDLSGDWKASAVQKQAENAVAMPNIPEMAAVWEFSGEMITKVISGNVAAEEAAAEAQSKMIEKIKEIRGR
jgi:maltose-binding protein MalE